MLLIMIYKKSRIIFFENLKWSFLRLKNLNLPFNFILSAPKFFKLIILIIFIFGTNKKVFAQDIESVVKSKAFEFSGNLSAGFSYNTSSGAVQNFAPLSYRVSFSPTITIKSFSLPFNFTYLDSDFSFSGPTTRFGFNPKYKWVQLYTGNNSFTLSPFTFSGQNVNGIGLQLSPKNFTFLAFYGKLQNFTAQRQVFDFASELIETFDRKTVGVKLGYNHKVIDVEFSGAKILDENNLEANIDVIKPMENVVFSSKITGKINSKINFGGELALSAITQDLTLETTGTVPDGELSLLNALPLSLNETTKTGFAGAAFLNFKVAKQQFSLNYKRVAPEYRSLGLFYINEDYKNITFSTSLRLLKNKLRVNSTLGRQNNNLNNLKSSESIRTIGSIDVSYQISKPLSLFAKYSNQTQNRQNTILSEDGTIEVGQTSKSFTINPRYVLSNETYTKSFIVTFSNFSFQRLQDNFTLEDGSSKNNSANASYSLSHKKNKWGLRIGANYFSSKINTNQSQRYGLSAGYNKTFIEKLRISVNTTFNRSESESAQSTIINLNSLNSSYKITKKQSLNLSVLQSNGVLQLNEKTSRLRLNLSYALNF